MIMLEFWRSSVVHLCVYVCAREGKEEGKAGCSLVQCGVICRVRVDVIMNSKTIGSLIPLLRIFTLNRSFGHYRHIGACMKSSGREETTC